MTRRWEERQQAFADLSDFAQENFSGIAVVKAFVKETKELMAFRKLNRENEEINVIYTRISTLLNILVTLWATAATWSTPGGSTPGSWWNTSATFRPSSGPSWRCPC